MDIKTLCQESHRIAKEHGFWEEERSFGEQIALMHSELSEALEKYRAGNPITEVYTSGQSTGYKPEGIPIELTDALIRIFDTCGGYDIDLEETVIMKMKYNESRPHKYGKVI